MNAPHQVLSCFSCRICDTVAIALVGFINPLQKGKSRQMGIFQSPPPLKDGETCTLSDEGHLKPSLIPIPDNCLKSIISRFLGM